MTHPSAFMPRAAPRAATFVSRREMSLPTPVLWAVPIFMLLTIAGVMTAGVPVSYLSAALLAGAVIWTSLRAQWLLSTGFYFCFAAMEGLYKYTTDFSSAVYIIKPGLIVVMAFLWWLSLKIDGRRIIYPPLSGVLGVMACLGFAQAFHPLGSGPALSLATLFLWYLSPAFFYFLICNELKTALQTRQLFWLLLIIATVVSAFSAFQFGMGQKWIEGHLPGYARITTGSAQWWVRDELGAIVSSFRPASTTAHTGAAASWGFLGIMLSCSLLVGAASALQRGLFVGLLMINSVGLVVTAVRAWVVIAIICVAMLLFLTSRSKGQLFRNLFILVLFSGIACAGFWVSEVLSGGILQRRYAQTLANPLAKLQQDRGENFTFLPLFVPRYPLGIGFQRGAGFRDNPGAVRPSDFVADDPMFFNRETQFNAITADLGVVGLGLFSMLMLGVLGRAYRTQREFHTPGAQPIGAVVFVILVGYAIACLSGPVLQGSEMFYLMAALATLLPAFPQISWHENAARENSTRLQPKTAPKALAR